MHLLPLSTAPVLPFAFATVALAVAMSCSWGSDKGLGTSGAGLGQACDGVLTNCAAAPDAGYTCVASKCRQECGSDNDCPTGTRCLWVDTANTSDCNGNCSPADNDYQGTSATSSTVLGFCVDNASVKCCTTGSSSGSNDCGWCPGNTACAADGYCRNMCSTGTGTGVGTGQCVSPESCENLGCPTGMTCGPQYCVGSSEHESAGDGGAQSDAGAGGAQELAPATTPTLVAADEQSDTDYVSWIFQGNAVDLAAGRNGTPMAVIDNGNGPSVSGLAAVGGFVYWVTQGGVYGCSETNCGSSNPMMAQAQMPVRVATNGTWLVWIDVGSLSVQGCSLASGRCSGSVQTFASAQQSLTDVAVDGSSVYWLGTGTNGNEPTISVYKCGLGTSCATSPLVVGNAPGAQAVAVSMGTVYAAGSQGGFECTSSGSCSSLLNIPGGAVSQLAADTTGVYAATASGPVFCPAPCSTSSNLMALDPTSGAAGGIAVTATDVYWSEASGGIFFSPKPGG